MGVTLTGIKKRRTTIELEESLYKRAKALAVEKDVTLKEIISEALEEKLMREEEKKDAENNDFMDNTLALKIIKEMERFLSREAAILLFRNKCEKRGINPKKITEHIITKDCLESLCNGITYISSVSKKECIEALKKVKERA